MKALFPITVFALLFIPAAAQQKTVTSDTAWTSRNAVLKNTLEADLIIRIGDVDNLGFGWPEDFDPFCGRMTQAHFFPWDADPQETEGFDRITISSSYSPEKSICGSDGYSASCQQGNCKPVDFKIPLQGVGDMEIKNVFLQLFIDDFQAPVFCSQFRVTLNGKRFVEAEKIFAAIEQTGPVGKLISIPVPEEFWPDLRGNALIVRIDETKGIGDGFAIDFMRLLINRKRENSCRGDLQGRVLDKETSEPVKNATVFLADQSSVKTDEEGKFLFTRIPTGYELVSASAKGYIDGGTGADIGEGSENPEVIIYLEKGGNSAQYNNKTIRAGESITLNNILFDQGKADLRPESKTELDKIVAFLNANPTAEIELSGHTSSEGEAQMNRSLSYKRVNACKAYIVSKGIDEGRILAVGFGPDKPVAPNDNESNRAKNRRVEMRVLKL